MRTGYDSSLAILTAMTESDLQTHESLQRLDFQSFLEKTGSLILKISATQSPKLPIPDAASVELIERRGDKAIVGWTKADGTKQKDMFKKIEGKWIPVSLDQQWQQGVAQLEAQLALLTSADGKIDREKQRALTTRIQGISVQLDSLLTTESKVKWNAKLGKLVQPLVAAYMKRSLPRGR